MIETVEYFAYGSNLSRQQMKERNIEVIKAEVVELPGWKLTFTVHSERWRGGAGDIVPKLDKRVEGVVYTIPKDDLSELDHYEGRKVENDMETGMYRRQHIPVKKTSGWVTVLTYLVNRTEEYRSEIHLKPSEEYMETIICGAEEHGLSEDYISTLENIKCR